MNEQRQRTRVVRFLDRVEVLGNRLPDPAVLFLLLLIAVWVFSALLAPFSYSHIDPRTGSALQIHNLATPDQLAHFLSRMVPTFVGFHPLGVVLLAMLGIGVADYTGFIRTGLKALMNVTSRAIVTPMLLLIAISQPQRRGCRLRAGDSPWRRHLPGGRPASACGDRSRLRGRIGRFQRELRAFGPRPPAAGDHPGGRTDHRSGYGAEPAQQLVLHVRIHAADRRPGLVPDRPDHRASPVGYGAGRRPGRSAAT